MKAYIRKKDYFFVLDRRIGEIEKVNDGLEADLIDYDTQKLTGITVTLKIGVVPNNNAVSLTSHDTSVDVVASHQLSTSMIHGGIFQAQYDTRNTVYVTDGIMLPNIGWPMPKKLK